MAGRVDLTMYTTRFTLDLTRSISFRSRSCRLVASPMDAMVTDLSAAPRSAAR